MESGDWRSQLQRASRQRMVNRITNTMKRHLRFSGNEALKEVEKIAARFEEKIYTTATSLSDYMRKISLKMQTWETRSQNLMPAANSINSSDPDIQGGTMESSDWRAQLQAAARDRMVNKIRDTLNRHFQFSGHEGLQELEKIADMFEDKIYTVATSQSDYLRRISLKMLSMETRSQNLMPNPMKLNSGAEGPQEMQQVNIQGQPLLIHVPSNHLQQGQLLSQTIHNNIASTGTQDSSIGNTPMESGDWRDQLQADSRQRIVNKIMDTLKSNLRFSGHEMLLELEKIAVRFEEKIYTAATSQYDYLRKISLKMLTMEPRSQNPIPIANSGANSVNS